VVSGGRGLGNAEAFAELEQLAAALGGAVGASRGAVDAGYQPTERQIGLSGKVVSPDLYIAVALSGAAQHMAGCSGSKSIVAINRDEEASIFKAARFGVVGDWKQVLPPFLAKVKELTGK
jgi:electron transfer flavoprotein alpha subunit